MTTSIYSDVAEEAEERKDRLDDSLDSIGEQAGEHEKRVMTEAKQIAEQVRAKVDGLPGSEKASEAMHGAADRLKKTASQLREHDDPSQDNAAISVLKSPPFIVALTLLIAGLLVSRYLRS